MSFSAAVLLGLALSLATALASVIGFLYKHRGAVASPEIEWRRPIRTSLALFKQPAYVAGIVVATIGWGFHVGALALAPISLVQTTIAGGLVFLTVIAERMFGHSVSRREWIGVALAAIGLAVLAATFESGADEALSDYTPSVLLTYLGVLTVGAIAIAYFGQRTARVGVLLGASAGVLWAVSDTAIKAQSSVLGEGIVSLLIAPLPLVILVFSIAGLVVSSKSLQLGEAVPVIAITSVAANSLTIAAGPIVFSEPLPDGALATALRIGAFGLVIVAAALTPAPVRAAEGVEAAA
ncbi:MAG: hypothetical protein ACR2K6_04340 [Solirubrobacterales bacterium]